MAIAFDSGSTFHTTNIASPWSLSHTNNGNLMIVAITHSFPDGVTLTTVTYDGIGMTKLSSANFGGTQGQLFVYYSTAPSTGANTLSVSWSGTDRGSIVVNSFSGVDVTTAFRSIATSTGGSSGTISASLASSATEWGLSVIGSWNDVNDNLTTISNMIQQSPINATTGPIVYIGYNSGSSETKTVGGSKTANRPWGHIVASIQATAAAGRQQVIWVQ